MSEQIAWEAYIQRLKKSATAELHIGKKSIALKLDKEMLHDIAGDLVRTLDIKGGKRAKRLIFNMLWLKLVAKSDPVTAEDLFLSEQV